LSVLLALLIGQSAMAQPASARVDRWWRDVSAIASDANEGRLTGSAGYLRAAAYVEGRFKAIGLVPAGDKGGYRQAVALEQQAIDLAATTAELRDEGRREPLTVGQTLRISSGGAPRPASVEAPLVFIGYGLHLPERGHDDLAGVDLRGKIAVVIAGGPAELSGPEKSNARNQRARYLAQVGAVGVIALTTAKQIEIPWARGNVLAAQPGMYLADARLRETPDNFFSGSLDPAAAERLFVGSGHTYAEVAALADASAALPRFALRPTFAASIVAARRPVTSPNLVAKLPGSDPKLRGEYVVLSAHLDHLGMGEPVNGDAVFNGTLDNAAGVASVLDIAARLKAGPRPKRSILFVLVTAEEKGELGSIFFAQRPTVPARSMVANLNFDMALPLWPLHSVIVPGETESTLGAVARAAAARHGLQFLHDPLPERNAFVRSDQYSFVKAKVPALAFKFGFEKGTPQFETERTWRSTRYHALSDNLDQPGVFKADAVRLDDYVASIALAVANAPRRPEWLATSAFNPVAAGAASR
jgi:hypothetical protein